MQQIEKCVPAHATLQDECEKGLATIASGWVNDWGIDLLMQAVCHTAFNKQHKPVWYITPWHTNSYG